MKKILVTIALCMTVLALPASAIAATTTENNAPTIAHPSTLPGMTVDENTSNQDIRDYFLNSFAPQYIGGFISIMGGITFMMVVISGIQYLTSYGNDEKMKQATKALTFSILGLVLSLLAWSIVSIISNISFGGQPDREVGDGTVVSTPTQIQTQPSE